MAQGRSSQRSSRVVLGGMGVIALVVMAFAVNTWRPSRPVQTLRDSEVPNVRSTDLKQTSVVASLDDPLPEHRNVIWCATFQMAWDKLKLGIIKEPIQLLGAEAAAERLNRAEFPPANIENESFYATAGFVSNGIIEEIQREMARRFPGVPVAPFDPRYKTLPKACLGYAYLSVGVPFKYPFFASKNPLGFTDSNGVRTSVRSFDTAPKGSYSSSAKVREQIDVLFASFDARYSLEGFTLDLCKYSSPYQVVLACVPREATLAATLDAVEKRTAEFKRSPGYGRLRNLDLVDSVVVPDVLFKLTHEYSELINRYLGNPAFKDCFIFDALQMIDFRLDRTGVLLKSEARLGGVAAVPREFRFDKPFLIYVKKRQADAKPFFVMWVDNAELMPAFPTSD